MTHTLITLFAENAFFSWLFDVAPKAAIGGAALWILLRWAVRYGNYEARFTRIELDLGELKGKVAAIDIRLARLEGRMDGLEKQMEIIIELLKGKNTS